jgi:hypothetical protein
MDRRYLLNLDLGGRPISLASVPAADGNGSGNITSTSRVRHEIKNCDADGVSILVDTVRRGMDIATIRVEVQYLAAVRRTQGLSHDECRVVDWPDGPLMECRLISGRG